MNAAGHDARTARLVRARRDSAARKQRQAMDAIQAIRAAGDSVSVSAVARAGQVSTWFIYNNTAVRTALTAAAEDQAQSDQLKPTKSKAGGDDRTLQGLRVELAGARDEIRALRGEQAQLRRRLERTLGHQIDEISSADLAARVGELTEQNLALGNELSTARAELARTITHAAGLQDELVGARAALRRMMTEVGRR